MVTPVVGDDDEKPMRYHIFKDHLTTKPDTTTTITTAAAEDDERNDSVIVRHVLDRLLDKLDDQCGMASNESEKSNKTTFDQYLFRCNQCGPTTTSGRTFACKSELSKHVRDEHAESVTRLKCVYCSELFETRLVADYLAHLKTNHKQFIINDLLLNKRGNKTFAHSQLDPSIDWSEYFASHDNSNRKSLVGQEEEKEGDEAMDISVPATESTATARLESEFD